MHREDYDMPYEDAETTALVQRYEKMLQTNGHDYFDEEEFEIIINHYFDQSRPTEALAAADYGKRQHPFSSDMQLQYAHALIQKGEVQQALQVLRKVETVAVNDPEVFFLKGLAYLHDHHTLNEALRFFDKAIKQVIGDEETIACMMSIAGALLEWHEYKPALVYLLKAQALAPDNLEVVDDLAFCYERLGDLEKSVSCHEQYLKGDPYDDDAWYRLGTIYGRLENFEMAVQAFRFAITLNDQHASAYFNLAVACEQLEQYTEAIELFEHFLRLEPDCPDAYLAIGECYDLLNNNAQAMAAFRKAIALDNDYTDAHFLLSLACTKEEDMESAFYHLHVAILLENDRAVYWLELAILFYLTDDMENFYAAIAKGLDLDIQAWEYLAERCPEAAQLPKVQLIYAHYQQHSSPHAQRP